MDVRLSMLVPWFVVFLITGVGLFWGAFRSENRAGRIALGVLGTVALMPATLLGAWLAVVLIGRAGVAGN